MSREFRTAVILAGGKSQRMGFDKQAIKINGEYLIQLIIEKLKTIGFEAFIIVSNKPSFYVDLQLGDDVKVVVDAIEDCGPLGGIYTGLVHSRDQKVFFTACDMPELNESYIKYMMERIDIIPDLVPKEHIFKKFDECVKWIEQLDKQEKV